ncbi:MAG: DEAD/DEAH box helicase [Natronomonas sp.]
MAAPASVAEAVPKEFADVFPFESFNRMQREALPAILGSDGNVVVSAPTASGKTALAEVAICRTLQAGGTALFLAPLRALTNEKEEEWDRFEKLGYSVYVVTGERDLDPRQAERADILVMTPEKADSATRKHDSPRYSFITDIDCCVIDEVHLLDSDRRGAVLEVTVSRLRRLCAPRIVALSATMQNVEDVAEWLDAPPECTLEFGDEYRPIPLYAGVETYTHGDNAFADKYRRLYRALDLAEDHVDDGGQALVFVSSRSDTVQAAKKTRDVLTERDVDIGARGDYDFHTETEQLENDTLRQSVIDGVGFHHAGLSKGDKDLVEEWFKTGAITFLFSTSTLAWGVNLPARCVVIRDTKLHDPLEGEVDMSPLDVLQMLGRAGRPGYDDAGYAYVVCDSSDVERYRQLLESGKPIESRLASPAGGTADELAAHLNAEIALGTIDGIDGAIEWLEGTFYYVRAQKSDRYDTGGIRTRLEATLTELIEAGFVERDGEVLQPTTLGRLASQFYLRLDTAEAFAAVCEGLDEATALRTIASADEFDSVAARRDERETVSAVLDGAADDLDAGNRKVLAILRASMDGNVPAELRSDAWIIKQNALRLLGALRAFCERLGTPADANLVARLETRIENGVSADAVGLTAIDGIGSRRAGRLTRRGFTEPEEIVDAGAEALIDAGLGAGVAERVVEAARELPSVEIDFTEIPDRIEAGENAVGSVTVRNEGGGAPAGVRVTVNGVEMSTKTTYLGELTLPIGVFGAPDAEEMVYEVTVAFSDLPLSPISKSIAVKVT